MGKRKVTNFKSITRRAEAKEMNQTVFIIKQGDPMAKVKQEGKTAQLENGYTPIANELIEAYYRGPMFPPYVRLHWFSIRMTYGYSRKETVVKLKEVADNCDIKKKHVVREFKKLASTGIIYSLKKIDWGKYEVMLSKEEDKFVKPVSSEKLDKIEIENAGHRKIVSPDLGQSQGKNLPRSGENVPRSGDVPIKENFKKKELVCTPTSENLPRSGETGGNGQGATNKSFFSSKSHTVPDDFCLTEGMRGYAQNKGMDDVDIDFEFEKFVQYNRGAGHKRVDWIAVWRYWCMRWAESKRKECGDDDGQFERVMKMIEEDDGLGAI